MDEKSILINLGDEKAKWISEVIGNKSCNKILDLLAEKNLTVSDISHKLKMPINTVDYNVKKLVKAGLMMKIMLSGLSLDPLFSRRCRLTKFLIKK